MSKGNNSSGTFRIGPVIAVLLLSIGVLFAGDNAVYAGGRQEESAAEGGKLKVFVSILPQRFFAEEIAGDAADIQVMVKPGQSPHSYEPSPSQITALGYADLYFTIGVDFEKSFIPEIRSALPNLPIIDSTRGIRYREIDEEDDHGEEEHEEHGGADPHVWLSPGNGKIIAANMKEALMKAAPEHASRFEGNYNVLAEKIDTLHEKLNTMLAPLEGETFLVFHPSFGYFADTYGLRQEAIETGGREPSPKELTALIEQAKAERVKVIFVQPQFSRKSAETIASAIGGEAVPIDPLAGDWLSNLELMAETIRRGIGEQ